MMTERELLIAPPSGLCACRIGAEYLHIAAISPCSVILRLPDEKRPAGALALQLYLPEAGRCEQHMIPDYQTGEAQHQQDAVLLRICFQDAACAAAIRRMMNAYARCLETKSTLGASAYAAMLSAYPEDQDAVFAESLQAQRRAWFSAMPALPEPGSDISLAVELNTPELWNAYLSLPLPDFMQAYARLQELPQSLLPRRLPDRLYLGNSFCRFLFPDDQALASIADKARREGVALTIVTADMPIGGEAAADACIAFCRSSNAELMVNDWGMLQRAAGKCSSLLGPLLNRRRKDPRFAYKPGLDADLPGRNSLSSTAWIEYLRDMGVTGYAWDACSLPESLPDGTNCLHLPFYQTNTSHWCPLQALALYGDRSRQTPSGSCARWCEENTLLHPMHLNMIGRWNSIFALNNGLATEDMHRFGRWVLNF